MRAILLLVLIQFGRSSFGAEPLIPALFHPRMTNGRYEQKIGDCRKMTAADIAAIHGWLKAGAWKTGPRAIPMVPEAGTFLFRQTRSNRAWVISLLAGTDRLIIHEAVIGIGGFPTPKPPLACARHERFAKILEAEVRRSFPEGAQRIHDEMELREGR